MEPLLPGLPAGLSWLKAAAYLTVFTTCVLNIVEAGRLQPGDKVLIHAGGSGVGNRCYFRYSKALG